MPQLIILFGLPGSGKTTLIKKIKKEFNINAPTILIDELVQKDPLYKKEVDIILKKCKTKKCLDSPSISTYKQFESAYWKTRKYGCNMKKCVDSSGCDCLNDTHLKRAIKQNKNIIFETSGTSLPDWLIKILPGHYKVTYYVILLDINNLIQRSIHRAYNAFMLYKLDHKIAPRLPRSDKKHLLKRMKTFHSLLLGLFKQKCNIILYDNINLKKIYDRQVNEGQVNEGQVNEGQVNEGHVDKVNLSTLIAPYFNDNK